jgi:hypothetical protein
MADRGMADLPGPDFEIPFRAPKWSRGSGQCSAEGSRRRLGAQYCIPVRRQSRFSTSVGQALNRGNSHVQDSGDDACGDTVFDRCLHNGRGAHTKIANGERPGC